MIVALMLAGGLGALMRFGVDRAVRAWLGPHFPWGTVLVNTTGALALGLLAGASDAHQVGSSVATVIGVGLLGGYTTFSTFTFDAIALAQRRRSGSAALFILVSLGVGLAVAGLGLAIGGAL